MPRFRMAWHVASTDNETACVGLGFAFCRKADDDTFRVKEPEVVFVAINDGETLPMCRQYFAAKDNRHVAATGKNLETLGFVRFGAGECQAVV